jgi:uncharacterized damage-inducible protein DinB
MTPTDLRYPIGQFRRKDSYSAAEQKDHIERIRQTPQNLKKALTGLSDAQLDTPYREGGWTVRQVAHHIPDSHLNAYLRVKLALTEDRPVIKDYQENDWARLADTRNTPLEVSVALLEALHGRWAILFESLSEADWKRQYLHPVGGPTSIEVVLAMYVWHGEHHIAHITNLRQSEGWTQ